MLVKNWELLEKQTYGYQETDEQKRVDFRKKPEIIANNRKVYVDEAGFDNREDYPYGYSLGKDVKLLDLAKEQKE